ncbi:hypothetical protein SAMN05216556_10686 [Aequorivita viscosa]|uniref:Uncharacterized protein n=1 Tax=Aequorivita viscosa TaxID=797419 RepID=A0A1M6DRP8_9FLAO|nr:hypothetical protein SAMN05216556_10686 [Aequorivita viscosa]SHI75789.1 hypothetical protein SAMN04487908_10586 [Aequorivita viscosa]
MIDDLRCLIYVFPDMGLNCDVVLAILLFPRILNQILQILN